MANINIPTAQNVNISLRGASIIERGISLMLDFVVISVYFSSLSTILGLFSPRNYELTILFFSIPVLFYHLLCETIFDGRSVGKMITGLKVIKTDGSPPTFSVYLIRWASRIIESPMFFLGVIPITTIIIGNKGQRLGDIAANTCVVSVRVKASRRDLISTRIPSDYKINFPQVIKLNVSDIKVIKEVINLRNKKNKNELQLLCKERVERVIGVKSNLKPSQFIYRVLMDYNYINRNFIA